ncbi:hypothetical protein pb186bvf_018443 [Paramecium bursaria]
MKSFEESIYSTNTSSDFNKLISMTQERRVEISILDPLSKIRIEIPIRHRNYNSKCCLFDKEFFLEFLREQSVSNEQKVKCPQCQNNMDIKDYGVHYDLYHYLALLPKIAFINSFKFQSIQKMYYDKKRQQYLVYKKDKQTNQQIEIYLPKGKDTQTQNQINTDQQDEKIVVKEINNLFDQMLNYYKLKFKPNLDTKQLARQINEMFHIHPFKVKQYARIHYEPTKNKQITFSIFQEKVSQNKYLITVYYVECKYYRTYELENENKNENFRHSEYASYYKDSTLDPHNYTIFVLGGMVDNYECSKDFYKILIPKEPILNESKLKVIRLRDLPSVGVNFHITLYSKQSKTLMIFNGQKIYVSGNVVEKEYLRAQWEYNIETGYINIIQQNIISPRYDGSSFALWNEQFPLAIFGGIKHHPEGRLPLICDANNFLQFFKTESKGISPEIPLKFDKLNSENKNCFTYPMLVIPFIDNKIVLYSSEILKQKLYGSRMAFILDLDKGMITYSLTHTMNVPDIVLTPFQIDIDKKDFKYYNPIQDKQGASLDGVFYTIMQQRDSQSSRQTIINLISINQATGKFTRHDYQKIDRDWSKHPNDHILTVI